MGGNFKNRRSKPPIERLEHSHRRLEGELEELQVRVKAVSLSPESDDDWQAIATIIDYLKRSVVRHEEDEEESVFPRLQSHPTLRPLLQRLRDDHASQRKLVTKLAKLMEQRDQPGTLTRLQRTSHSLIAAYLDHIAREDRQLLPAIARYCSSIDEAQMAEEMTARRDSDERG